MRCHICDRALTDTEVVWNKDTGSYEPCSTCLEIALDAAYSGGFSPDDEPLDDVDMQEQFGNGAVETIDPDVVFISSSGTLDENGYFVKDYDDVDDY